MSASGEVVAVAEQEGEEEEEKRWWPKEKIPLGTKQFILTRVVTCQSCITVTDLMKETEICGLG